MRIKKIEIINFKGFQHKTIEFKNNLTVVIGNNTAGKTTLLKGLQIGLGAYLQCLNSLIGPKYRRNFSTHDVYRPFDPITRDYTPLKERTKITIDADFVETIGFSFENLSFQNRAITWKREYTGSYTTHTRACAGN